MPQTVHVAFVPAEKRFHFTDDRDCLPADCHYLGERLSQGNADLSARAFALEREGYEVVINTAALLYP